MTYAISGSGIIHETLDDEVIIANLNEGIYYSIRGSGTLIWQFLIANHSLSSIEFLFSEKYNQPIALSSFIEELQKENILIPSKLSSASPVTPAWPATFQDPVLERYDEMKNLLMLDPIHEVDEQGWPHQK